MDPIADMLTAIRNANAVKKETVSVPFSAVKYEIAKILAKNGFAQKIESDGRKTRMVIKITAPALSGLKRISKPGQRIYKSFREIKPVKSGYGIAIISTSKGLMTDKEARKQKLGGEVICEIW